MSFEIPVVACARRQRYGNGCEDARAAAARTRVLLLQGPACCYRRARARRYCKDARCSMTHMCFVQDALLERIDVKTTLPLIDHRLPRLEVKDPRASAKLNQSLSTEAVEERYAAHEIQKLGFGCERRRHFELVAHGMVGDGPEAASYENLHATSSPSHRH